MDGVLAGGEEAVMSSKVRLLKGALASKKGKGMSFARIREAAAEAARGREASSGLAKLPARRATQT
jgi:hypothetical protein